MGLVVMETNVILTMMKMLNLKKRKVLKIKQHYRFKTILCENLTKRGFCCYGENCMYIHDYKSFHRTKMRKSLNIIKKLRYIQINGWIIYE